MADAVVSPPVRVLDFGWQAPNSIDYQRAGAAAMAPITQAVENINASKNSFLMAQLQHEQQQRQSAAEMANARYLQEMNADKAFKLAQLQNYSQLQREEMRDNRFKEVMRQRGQDAMALQKQKAGESEVSVSLKHLNDVGGTAPPRQDGETDQAYKARVDDTAAGKVVENTKAHAQLLVAAAHRNEQLDNYVQNNPDIAQLQKTAADNTQAEAVQKASDQYLQNHPEVQKVMADNKIPINQAIRLTGNNPNELLDTFNAYHEAFQNKYLKDNGKTLGQGAEILAGVKAEKAQIAQRVAAAGMMPAPGGRGQVRAYWATDGENMANQQLQREQEEKNQQLQQQAAQRNPSIAPAMAPPSAAPPSTFDTSGAMGVLRGSAGSMATSMATPFQGAAALPGLASRFMFGGLGSVAAPGQDEIQAAIAQRNARMGAAGVPQRSYFVPSPAGIGPTPQPQSSMMVPQAVQMPDGPSMPMGGSTYAPTMIPPPSPDSGNDQLMNMWQMRNLYQ